MSAPFRDSIREKSSKSWSFTGRERGFLAVGMAVILTCYAFALLAPAVGLFHDDGIYVVTAKALAEGSGYRIISLPIEIEQTKYPVLFPYLLSLVWRVFPDFPDNLVLLKMVPFLAALAWSIVAWRLLEEETGKPRWAAGIVFLTLAAPYTLLYSTIPLSETSFAALLWVGLFLLGRYEDRSAGEGALIVSSAAFAAAFHVRTLGVVAGLAGVLALMSSRRYRSAFLFASIFVILSVPWLLWLAMVPEVSQPWLEYYTGANYREWNVLFSGLSTSQAATVVTTNLVIALLSPSTHLGMEPGPLLGLYLVLTILMGLGFWRAIRARGPRSIHLLAVLYLLALLVWTFPPTRFVFPLLPLMILYGVAGAAALLERLPNRTRGLVAAAGIILVGGVTGWQTGIRVSQALNQGTVCRTSRCEADWDRIREVMDDIRRGVPDSAVLAGNPDPALYLYTGRKAIRSFDYDPYLLFYARAPASSALGTAGVMARRLQDSGADYFVLPGPGISRADSLLDVQLRSLQEACPGFLVQIGSPGGATRLYEIRRWACGLPEERAVGLGLGLREFLNPLKPVRPTVVGPERRVFSVGN